MYRKIHCATYDKQTNFGIGGNHRSNVLIVTSKNLSVDSAFVHG